jgi:MFS family permease
MGFTQIGQVAGPALGGFLLDHFGFNHPFMVFSTVGALSILGVPMLLIVHWKQNKNRVTGKEAEIESLT